MLGQMERFIKQALVDRNPLVSGSALISGQTLFKISPDVVKRWVNEVQDALNSSSSPMVQYHALALLYQIKKNDRLALSKVISALAKKPPKSPLAHCLLIRYTLQVLGMNPQGAEEKALMDFLVSSLHKSNSMVNFEAAKALCFLPSATPAQIAPAITVLQELLNSAVPCQRFAAVRTLNAIVSKFPMYVAPCRVDLELLITDSNRSIATLAITTLLKTGVEGSIDTLMKTMSGFMSEIGDDLRIVLIEAIQQLVVKFPYKFDIFLEFLSSILREEGGFTYKKTIVDSIISILKANEEAKELCLEYLCDFIEDCEYPLLSVQILDFLGQEGPKTKSPSRFIRYIFNRVILEQPRVRSAAVASLAKFAAVVPSLTDSVLALMQRCLIDNDDEVRDRAVYYSEIFSEDREEAANTLQHRKFWNMLSFYNILLDFNIPLSSLEYSLYRYVEGDALTPFTPGDISAAPEDAKPSAEQKSSEIKEEVLAIKDNSIDALKSIPEFEALGKLYK
jgi:coatomer protein complex subunit gamma